MADDEIPTIRDVFVANVMSESVQVIPADASAVEAAQRLFEDDIGSLLVGADSTPPDGIVTETDFVELVAMERDPAAATVKDCMSSPVVTVEATASLENAAERMTNEDIKKLPVVKKGEDVVVGVITTTDIAKYLPIHEFHPDE